MIRWDREKYPTISEGLLQLAVAQYVQWWRNFVVPNLCLFHEMDVAVLTRAGCLWEFEIKVSQIKCDVIVVGHQQKASWASRWWRGSVGKSLLDCSPCSIYITQTRD